MSGVDKSAKVGFDEQDEALERDLEAFLRRNPNAARKHMHRIHDGIMHRLKEDAARKCSDLLKDMEQCVNRNLWSEDKCYPQRNAVNACYQAVNSEDNYQRVRRMYLRGELLEQHHRKLLGNVETMKQQAPQNPGNWNVDWAERVAKVKEEVARMEDADA